MLRLWSSDRVTREKNFFFSFYAMLQDAMAIFHDAVRSLFALTGSIFTCITLGEPV